MVTFAQSPRPKPSLLELHLITMGEVVDKSIPHAVMRITSIGAAALLSYAATLPGIKACGIVAKDCLPYGLLLASSHTESFL